MPVGSLPASRAPSSNLSQSMPIFSSAAPTVIIPSASLPVRLALTGPAVATYTGTGRLGPRVELRALEREVVALVLDDLAGEQLVDDLDGLEHHRAADADLRPRAPDDMLVERLAGAQPQPEPAGEHGAQRRRGVGDDGGVVAKAGARHRGPERQRRPRPERAHERPREGALALLRGPRVEVLADHEPGRETGVLGLRAPVEQVGRVELLEHRGVADRRHGRSVASEWSHARKAGCHVPIGRTVSAPSARSCRRRAVSTVSPQPGGTSFGATSASGASTKSRC